MSGTDSSMGSMSLMDLFRQEVETHCGTLSTQLLALEEKSTDPDALAALMRAAHSLKGAARIMDIAPVVSLTHAMEDVFVAGQEGGMTLDGGGIDLLLKGVDMLTGLLSVDDDDLDDYFAGRREALDGLAKEYQAIASGRKVNAGPKTPARPPQPAVHGPQEDDAADSSPSQDLPAFGTPEEDMTATPSPAPESKPGAKPGYPADLSSMSMMDLFRQEAETHCATLTDHLLVLEEDPVNTDSLAALMRAAHSIKGAARVIDLHIVVGLAHAMEDVFVAAQEGRIGISQGHIDELLKGTDLFLAIAEREENLLAEWFRDHEQQIKALENIFRNMAADRTFTPSSPSRATPVARQSEPETPTDPVRKKEVSAPAVKKQASETIRTKSGQETLAGGRETARDDSAKAADRALRVSAEGMNRLMGFAGEVRVESRWLPGFAQKMLLLKHRQDDFYRLLNNFGATLGHEESGDIGKSSFRNLLTRLDLCRNQLNELLGEAEDHARRSTEISHHLYQEVLANRMRPFIDGVRAYPRMVRDVARELGKAVHFEIVGEDTLVDRDILEKIEAPLNHLVRNAVDHGIESPEERLQAGKPEKAHVTLEARHSAGMLSIVVSDDGSGIDIEKLRRTVIAKKMLTSEAAAELREAELLEFLFLPNFTTRDTVSKVSGRGVGLDVVHSAVHEVRGIIRINTELGIGTAFEMQLPLTLSVMRSLLVEIDKEVYAFPLVAIDHVLNAGHAVKEVEGRQYVLFGQERIGLVSAHQVLSKPDRKDQEEEGEDLLILIISDHYNRYGLIVDRFLEIRDLVVQPLDRRLKKVQDISSVAILEDGTPVLIVDVEDMVRSIDSLISGNRLRRIDSEELMTERSLKRILVVDDSITVREVERKMLSVKGYEVVTAVDGMDGWNILRSQDFDLVVSDIDMPRMDGIEFVTLIRQDARYANLPVIIVSYKDREEDRNRGLEAGADSYLTKGSFQDETLVKTVEDLIGPPQKRD